MGTMATREEAQRKLRETVTRAVLFRHRSLGKEKTLVARFDWVSQTSGFEVEVQRGNRTEKSGAIGLDDALKMYNES